VILELLAVKFHYDELPILSTAVQTLPLSFYVGCRSAIVASDAFSLRTLVWLW